MINKLKYKILVMAAVLFVLVSVFGGVLAASASAGVPLNNNVAQLNFNGPNSDCSTTPLTTANCGIIAYVVLAIRTLSALVGIVVVLMIVVGGIQYTTARDDPQAVSVAKTRIRNAIFALVFYLFAIAFLQWLVPGGVF